MVCPHCNCPTVDFVVPETYREYVPDTVTAAMASICTHCLTVRSIESSAGAGAGSGSGADTGTSANTSSEAETEAGSNPDFTRVSPSFPTGEAAIPVALLLGNCTSLATNRTAIETLLEEIQRTGTDPLLAIERLLAEPTSDLEPAIDLERRHQQLEQLFY